MASKKAPKLRVGKARLSVAVQRAARERARVRRLDERSAVDELLDERDLGELLHYVARRLRREAIASKRPADRELARLAIEAWSRVTSRQPTEEFTLPATKKEALVGILAQIQSMLPNLEKRVEAAPDFAASTLIAVVEAHLPGTAPRGARHGEAVSALRKALQPERHDGRKKTGPEQIAREALRACGVSKADVDAMFRSLRA